MIFPEEKRRLLGVLALLAPLPLPFNEVLEWSLLVLYEGLVLLYLRRAVDPQARWLPSWSMNLLGLLYLPVLFFDVQLVFARGQVVQTMVHVCMFAVLVKLYSLRKESDVWVSLGAIFFLFLAGTGTSVHPTVLLYLLLFTVLSLLTLLRLTQYRLLGRYGWKGPPPRVPVGRFLTFGMVVAVILSIPLFAVFPRVRSPMIGVRGVGTGTVIHAAGFTDNVTLDSIGAMRQNPEVAVRLRFAEGHGIDGELRLRGATFDTYEGRRWLPTSARGTSLVPEDGKIWLHRQPPDHWIDLWLQPLGTRVLFLPVQAVAVEVAAPTLGWDRAGAISLWGRPSGVLAYRVGVVRGPVQLAGKPFSADREPALDTSAVTPRIAALAQEVAGNAASPEEAAVLLERHLMDSYAYSTGFVGLAGDNPLEEFLFRHRQGHCELFASALVLMLRSQGIPARLVTGFLGGELNPLTGYYVVRQSNAHAWVEAYLPDSGWRILDPTPPAGRPDADGLAGWSLFQQAYDYLQFRWDRYVLTYGFQDQVSYFWRLRSFLGKVRDWFQADDPSSARTGAAESDGVASAPEASAAETSALSDGADARALAFRIALVLLAAVLLLWLAWQRRRVLTATEAFRRLRRRAEGVGIPLTEATAPWTVAARLESRFPEVREPAARVIEFYLRESFGNHALTPQDRGTLIAALSTAQRRLRRGSP